jgi:transposase-like protein
MGRPISAFNGPVLTPKQEAVALAMASGLSLQDTARQAGVGETTVKRWLRGPALVQRIRELRRELTDRAAGRLADAMTTAVNTLVDLCVNGETETTRLKAADSLLTHGPQLNGLAELEARLAELDQPLPGRKR